MLVTGISIARACLTLLTHAWRAAREKYFIHTKKKALWSNHIKPRFEGLSGHLISEELDTRRAIPHPKLGLMCLDPKEAI